MVKTVAIDAETGPVGSRPDYPPRACGYSVRVGRKGKYWAFGHDTGNNCTRREAVAAVRSALREGKPMFHNADFDLEVLAADGVTVKGDYFDTMREAFLFDPRSRHLGLKEQAEQHLGMPPRERNELREWIIAHVPEAKRSPKKWAEHIPRAPGYLAGRYANGDTDRTVGLHEFYMPDLREAGMIAAYEREMALIPIKLQMERTGIRVRVSKLKRELPKFRDLHRHLASQIQRRLKTPNLNIGSSPQLAKVLVERGLLRTVVRTKTGKVSTKRALLEQNCSDRKLVLMLGVWGTLDTYLGTFMERWLETGERNDGYVQPTFNTVRSTDEWGGDSGKGARTGRFSSSDPNFQNIPSNVVGSPHEKELLELQKMLAALGVDFIGLRDYFEPDEGHVFIRRDYNQQELRILAHNDYDEETGEIGPFLQRYLDDPKIDAHIAVQQLVLDALGVEYPRKHVKITNFGIVYGMGLAKLAARLGIDIEDARRLREAVLRVVPGIRRINKRMKRLAKAGEPFYTWGGRRYYCEEPVFYDTEDGGRAKRTLEYKMLNTQIQGSAADCTKQGMINTYQNCQHARLVLQVHDELLMSVPRGRAKIEMRRMKDGMEDVAFRVPMLTDGETGGVSWARMKKTA